MALEDAQFTNVLQSCCDGMVVVTGRLEPGERAELTRPEIEIAIPGERAVAEITYRTADRQEQRRSLTDKHVSIIPAGQPHRVAWRRPADVTMILLSPRFVAEVARCGGIERFELVEEYAALDPIVWHLGRELRAELRRRRALDPRYLESVATVLARHVVETYAWSPRESNGLPRYKLRQAIQFIRDNLDRNIGFHDIAAHLNMSPYHFSRMFKRSAGDSPHRYVVRCRVERAKELLVQTSWPITDVAFDVGYRSQSHFTTCFSRLVGVSPAAFRAGG
jgi:AraC family transcriptional regulator